MAKQGLKSRISHINSAYFSSDLYKKDVMQFLDAMIDCDLRGGNDVTTKTLGIEGASSSFLIRSKSNGVFCGGWETEYYLKKRYGRTIRVQLLKNDGDEIRKGDHLISFGGQVGKVFEVERTILNVCQRLSGIATEMSKYVRIVGSSVLVCPTRKTIIGSCEKRACMLGGGGTHRINLADAVLLKKTHLALENNDFEKIFNKVSASRKKRRFIEIECENINQVKMVFDQMGKLSFRGKLFVLMFDNMRTTDIKKMIGYAGASKLKNIIFEASGGISDKNIKAYANSGVDVISIGKITGAVQPLDFHMVCDV